MDEPLENPNAEKKMQTIIDIVQHIHKLPDLPQDVYDDLESFYNLNINLYCMATCDDCIKEYNIMVSQSATRARNCELFLVCFIFSSL